MAAKFVWNELITADQMACGDFYCALFDWQRKEIDMGSAGTYTLFQQNDSDIAGMMNPATSYSRLRPSFWSAYIAVDDADEFARKAESLGGTIIAAPEDISGVGRVCMICDPSGASVCLMTPVVAESNDGAGK